MQISLEDRIVVFIDLIGFREITTRATSNASMRRSVSQALSEIQRTEQFSKLVRRRGIESMKFTAFSDCWLTSDRRSNIFGVIEHARSMVGVLLAQGFASRGGIAVGPMYHSDRVVFGEALVCAYELESRVARVPRIVIHEALAKKFIKKAQQLIESKGFPWKADQLAQKDADGVWFLEPFAEPRPAVKNRDFLRATRHTIAKGLKRAQGAKRLDHYSKWAWLGARYNKAIATAGRTAPKPIEL